MKSKIQFPILFYPSFSILLRRIREEPTSWSDGPNCVYFFGCMNEKAAINKTFSIYYESASQTERNRIMAILAQASQEGRCRWKMSPSEFINLQEILSVLKWCGVEGLPNVKENSYEECEIASSLHSLRDFLKAHAGEQQVSFMCDL